MAWSPECSATVTGFSLIWKWVLLTTSVTACSIYESIFSAPFGIFYVRTEIWKETFQKKIIYKPLVGCSLSLNSHFQMGVTVMGFAEHFGLWVLSYVMCVLPDDKLFWKKPQRYKLKHHSHQMEKLSNNLIVKERKMQILSTIRSCADACKNLEKSNRSSRFRVL